MNFQAGLNIPRNYLKKIGPYLPTLIFSGCNLNHTYFSIWPNKDLEVTSSYCGSQFFYHGILQSNYRKMAMKWSFSNNLFVNLTLYNMVSFKTQSIPQTSRKRQIRHIFTPTFGFVCIHFLQGILIYPIFFLLKLLKNTWRQQRESKFGFCHKRSEDRQLIRCPRACHKMSSCPIAVGGISFSSWPIRMSHSDCVCYDRTIITPV